MMVRCEICDCQTQNGQRLCMECWVSIQRAVDPWDDLLLDPANQIFINVGLYEDLEEREKEDIYE